MNKNSEGFTLIELSIAGFLMVILGFGILGLQQVLSDSQFFGFTNYANVDEANYTLTLMAREVRTMRSGQNGAYPIILADDNELSFYSDIDYNGESDRVRYWLEGTTLRKSVTPPTGFPATYLPENTTTRIIAENVRNQDSATPLFLYFNADWPVDTDNNPLPTPANLAEVRLVRISLDINVNPDNAGRSTYSLGTNVNLRILNE